jgi:hypothetical protein
VPGVPGLNRAAEALDYRKGENVSGYEDFGSSLRDLPRLRSSRRIRVSSWDRSDDYSSVAYWYQAELHRSFSILPVERRVPRQR